MMQQLLARCVLHSTLNMVEHHKRYTQVLCYKKYKIDFHKGTINMSLHMH